MTVTDICPPHGIERPTHPANCSCDDCWLAHRLQVLDYRRSGHGWTHVDREQFEHSRSRYKQGCRCDVCRKAESDYTRVYRRRVKASRSA